METNSKRRFCQFAARPGLFRFVGLVLALLLVFATAPGCLDDGDSARKGVFTDSPVAGLDFRTPTLAGTTDEEGTFHYHEGETVTFSVGDVELGSAVGAPELSPKEIVEGGEDASHPAVVNISRFLQTLDKDGDLNNGIQITPQIAGIASAHAGALDFGQSPADFGESAGIQDMLAEMNAAGVFTDLDPRPRALRDAADAREHLARTLAPRHTVTTAYGDLRGFEPAENPDTWQWLGIPYAKPPVGELRWRPPQPPEPWSGVREATQWGDQAAQNPRYQAYGEGGMSEDCLYLNITAPKDADNLPVMVWFHGGAFSILTGNAKSYNNPAALPTKGVVMVTVNHRLGPFGYMAHPLLSQESDYGGSGNYGQMDLVAALEWVQENISAFGGNPDNVTIFGESGGGMKSISLMSSPLAVGLFDRVICESGMSPAPTPDLATAESIGTIVTDELGADTLEEMRAAPWYEIATLQSTDYSEGVRFAPNVDNYYMTKTMEQTIIDGLPSDVPLMAGANTDDMEALIYGFLQHMPLRASNCTAPQYAYVFSHVPSGWVDMGVGAYHAIELVYVFNYPASFYSHYLLGLPGLPVDYTKSPQEVIASTGYGPVDAQLSQDVMTIWAQFARTGDPGVQGLADWPAYTVADEAYLEIKPDPEVKYGLEAAFPETGTFVDSPVEGLSYSTETLSGQTNEDGQFKYRQGESVTFSVGELELGTAAGGPELSPVDLVPGASGPGDTTVVNISRLLQTLDEDGDLNNGIRITSAIADIVSDYADYLVFGQSPGDFASDSAVTDLLADLNAAGVFTDLDPRPRTLRSAEDAQAHLQRTLAPRHTVSTAYGDLRGFEPAANADMWQWLGIPYAKPPVGELRWRPPQAPEPWSGVREATQWGDQAPQNPRYQAYGEGGMSEDCLYLNITAPKDAENLPVMVWFHGGGITILTGNTDSYNNPDGPPTKDVVLVTVNHRLGPFGYLAHPLLSQESDYGGSGNYGQMDLIAALEWIRENISAFGGNPENITIFGQSGGGSKVLWLMASPQAAGLFEHAIVEAGCTINEPLDPMSYCRTLVDAEEQGLVFEDKLGTSGASDRLAAMRSKPWTEIVEADLAEPEGEAQFTIDGHYLTDSIYNTFAAGNHNDVPFMIGAGAGEPWKLMGIHLWNDALLTGDSNMYVYAFNHVPSGWEAMGVNAYHAIELVYQFNYVPSFYSHYLLGLTGLEVDYSKSPAEVIASTGWSAEDVQVTDMVMTMWTNFARTGDPTSPAVAGAPDWTPYTLANQAYMEITSAPQVKYDLETAFGGE